jgi:hypothetical protein
MLLLVLGGLHGWVFHLLLVLLLVQFRLPQNHAGECGQNASKLV